MKIHIIIRKGTNNLFISYYMKKNILIIILLFIIDQILKILVVNNLILNVPRAIIKNFFNLTYVKNYGAAWSIFSGNRLLLIIISFIALIFIYKFMIKNNNKSNFENICYSILLGGILGNLCDRIIYGYVIDYLDFTIFGYQYPIFNFADICIVISIFLIICLTLKEGKNNGN